jgi:hypothetical protein
MRDTQAKLGHRNDQVAIALLLDALIFPIISQNVVSS